MVSFCFPFLSPADNKDLQLSFTPVFNHSRNILGIYTNWTGQGKRSTENSLQGSIQAPNSPKVHGRSKSKNKTFIQHTQNQIPRHQHKNKINNSQINRSPWEPTKPTIAGSDYFNIAETQEKDLKIAIMNIIEVLKMNKSPKEIQNYTTESGRKQIKLIKT